MRSGRLGLMGIHERARLFGGRAAIASELGVGTMVRVVIPLSAIVTAEQPPWRRTGMSKCG